MPIQETPTLGLGDQRLLLHEADPRVERLAKLLSHRCIAWERATGNADAMDWRCQVCGEKRSVLSLSEQVDWWYDQLIARRGV